MCIRDRSYSGARLRLGDLFRAAPGEPMKMQSFLRACDELCQTHADRVHGNLERHGVTCLAGRARLAGPHRVIVNDDRELTTEVVLIATGARPARPDFVPFDQPGVHTSDSILEMDRLPRRMTVVSYTHLTLPTSDL